MLIRQGQAAPPPLIIATPSSSSSTETTTALQVRLQQEGKTGGNGGRAGDEKGVGPLRKPEEYFVSTDFFEERETVIPPDVTLAQDEDLGGMLFHVF